MTALPAKPGFGPRGLLDVQAPSPRGLLDISGFDANIRRSAAEAVRNLALPPLPTLAPVREPPRPYRGAEMAAQGIGTAMDINDVATHGAKEVAKRVFRAPGGFDIVKPLSKGLRRVGGVATVLQEGFGAADDIKHRRVPRNIAIPGAIYRGSAALGMSAFGGLIGSILLPGLGTALGAAAGGLLSEKLPSREFFAREVPKAMEGFGRHPYYDDGF